MATMVRGARMPAAARSSAAGKKNKLRKPYTITRPRERWTDDEHERFLHALHIFGRDWKSIEAWWRPRRACRSAATRRSTSSRPRSSASGRACRRRFTLAAPRPSASSRRPTATLTPTCWCRAWTGHAPRLNPAGRTSTRRAHESGRPPVPCTCRTKPLRSRCLPTTCASLWSTGSSATSSPPTRLSRSMRNSRGFSCRASTPSWWTRSWRC
ncbi:hypothetical protein ACQJBY_001118 [Aegilops geniculata]